MYICVCVCIEHIFQHLLKTLDRCSLCLVFPVFVAVAVAVAVVVVVVTVAVLLVVVVAVVADRRA